MSQRQWIYGDGFGQRILGFGYYLCFLLLEPFSSECRQRVPKVPFHIGINESFLGSNNRVECGAQ